MKYNNIKYKLVMLFMIIVLFFGSINFSEAATFNTGMYPGDSFIDPTVSIDVTNFSIGSESYIAPFTSFSGDYVSIGSYSDIQDGVSNSGSIKIDDDAVVAHGGPL